MLNVSNLLQLHIFLLSIFVSTSLWVFITLQVPVYNFPPSPDPPREQNGKLVMVKLHPVPV